MSIACAESPEPTDDGPPNGAGTPLPEVAEIVCEPDGATQVLTPEVVVQSDGVHIHVNVLLEEAAFLDGFRWVGIGPKIQPGERDLVTTDLPGSIDVACRPESQRDSESFEPGTAALDILDPEGLYVSEELECLPGDDTAGWTTDWAPPGPDRDPPVTPAEARSVLERLEPGDLVAYAGYPERPGYQIAVKRDERTIAIMWFYRDGETVDSDSGGICEGEAVFTSAMVEHGDDR
jgi:hypothetical protein